MPASIDHLLVHRADVERISPTDLGNGRFRDDYVPHLGGILFRLSMGSTRERTAGDQWQTVYGPIGYLLPATDIQRMDIVCNILLENGTTDQRRYRVTGVQRPSLQHHMKVVLEVFEKQASA
jgi:hypothetical protein